MTASYETNDNKPQKDLVNYSTVRVPELRLIYRTLGAAGVPINVSTLKDAMVPSNDHGSKNDAHLGECRKFLRTIDLLERPEDRVVSLLNEDVYPDLSFELRLLYHLNRHCEFITKCPFVKIQSVLVLPGSQHQMVDSHTNGDFECLVELEHLRIPVGGNGSDL